MGTRNTPPGLLRYLPVILVSCHLVILQLDKLNEVVVIPLKSPTTTTTTSSINFRCIQVAIDGEEFVDTADVVAGFLKGDDFQEQVGVTVG